MLSLSVETGQLFLSGRHASLGDLTTNTVGAAIGIVLLHQRARLLRPTRRVALTLAATWTAFAVTVLVAATSLLTPTMPDTVWWGQWTPILYRTEPYRGRVLSARIGDLDLPSYRLPSSDSVRTLFATGHPIEIVAIAGPAPSSPSKIFSIADEQPREILMIGASGDDFVFRVLRASADYLLDRPDLRIHDALAGVRQGDTIRLSVRQLPDEAYRLQVNEMSRDLRVGVADTWSLFLWPEWVARSSRAMLLMRVLWLGALALPAVVWIALSRRASIRPKRRT